MQKQSDGGEIRCENNVKEKNEWWRFISIAYRNWNTKIIRSPKYSLIGWCFWRLGPLVLSYGINAGRRSLWFDKPIR
jgi:hypothetical protein